jgi:guanylate kinase
MTLRQPLGLLFVLVGPPGVGKNTLMNAVLKRIDNLNQLPTATTRSRRPNEQHGREHLFITHDEFEHMQRSNQLIESQEVHGEWYGMPKSTVEEAIFHERDLIADIDVKGATYLHMIYPDNAVLIFIQPESTEDLRVQMQTRGESEAEIEKRMRRVNMEMQYAPSCDYLITNEKGNAEKASDILHGIVLAERSHRDLLKLRAEKNLPSSIESSHEPA